MPDPAFPPDARAHLQSLLDRLGLPGWVPLLVRNAEHVEYGFWHRAAAGPPPLVPGWGGAVRPDAGGLLHMESPRVSRLTALRDGAPLPAQFRQHALELAGMALAAACLAHLPVGDDAEGVRPAPTARWPDLKILMLGSAYRCDVVPGGLQAELLVTAFDLPAGGDDLPERSGPAASRVLELPLSGDLGALAFEMRAEAVAAFERTHQDLRAAE